MHPQDWVLIFAVGFSAAGLLAILWTGEIRYQRNLWEMKKRENQARTVVWPQKYPK